MRITNERDIPIALAVWLLHDEYDYIKDDNYVSVTTLMKPLRQILLPKRVPKEMQVKDVEDFVSRSLGHSLHDSIEKAWKVGYARSLKLMGYPEKVISQIKINPQPDELVEGMIPVYLEQRNMKEIVIKGVTYIVGGKFDMVAEGILHDFKSTTAYSWLFGTRDEEYKLQGSLYRWLNPDKITEDFIRIAFIFTDWQKMSARTNPNYPQHRILYKDIPLMSIEETEKWIVAKLTQVHNSKALPETKIPECTEEELWRSAPQHKYYADPQNITGRSTKNFDDLAEANAFLASKGKGVVITIPGEVKRCGYCDAYPICTQRMRYFP